MVIAGDIQAVLVEDHLALRKGMELLLREAGVRVIGVAESGEEGIRLVLDRQPDVAVVDLMLAEGSGLQLAREVLRVEPDAGILFYTGGADPDLLRAALDSGARGFALKAGGPAELLAAVQVVAAGSEYVDPRLARMLDGIPEPNVLTRREREVLDLLAQGLRGEEVAGRLFVSPQTVQTHVRNVMRKLGARTRVHALALAHKLREIDLD